MLILDGSESDPIFEFNVDEINGVRYRFDLVSGDHLDQFLDICELLLMKKEVLEVLLRAEHLVIAENRQILDETAAAYLLENVNHSASSILADKCELSQQGSIGGIKDSIAVQMAQHFMVVCQLNHAHVD